VNEVLVTCDVRRPGTPLPHAWEHTVGSGHALLALRTDYQAQLRRCHDELGFAHVRFHGLLCDDVGTLVCKQHVLRYSFFNVDSIWDALLAMGMRPFVELSFMPATLAATPRTVFHYAARIGPPSDYDAWSELIRRLAAHAVARYGRDEVGRWLFEVWNEPNLASFWAGTQGDYFRFYQHTVHALKGVDPALQVGGPATANNGWIADFIGFCERTGTALDFVTTHHYPTDAFGRPDDDTEAQLAASRRSVLRDRARATHDLVGARPLYYTEWSSSSNSRDPLHDEPYAAPVVVKTMLEARGLTRGYSWWTFSDVFEENYFASAPFHGGFGLLTIYGIPKPSYRAFEILHHLGTDLVYAMENVHPTVDAWVVRRPTAGDVTVVLTNHALPRHEIADAQIHIALDGVARPVAVTTRRIDATHCNAKARWRALGSAPYLDRAAVDDLTDASRLAAAYQPWTYQDGTVHIELDLPPHAVASVTVDCSASHVEHVDEPPTPCP
jgi:xylan 1,4-beta-xylosidase